MGWDPYPKADVSTWDGVQGIVGDVNKMPFYHVIPDLNDTVKAFGQERPFRYVCQDNLVICPPNEQDIEVSLDEGWSASEGGLEFKPPNDLKFCHSERVPNDNIVVTCLNDLQTHLNECFLKVRDGGANTSEDKDDTELSLQDFFTLLHNTECLEDAFVADEGIKQLWKAHRNQDIRCRLDDGIANLLLEISLLLCKLTTILLRLTLTIWRRGIKRLHAIICLAKCRAPLQQLKLQAR